MNIGFGPFFFTDLSFYLSHILPLSNFLFFVYKCVYIHYLDTYMHKYMSTHIYMWVYVCPRV